MKEQKNNPLSINKNPPPDGFRYAPGVNPEHYINPDQRITVKQLSSLLGVGVSTVWKMVADQRLQPPEKYGNRCSRWRYGDIFPHQVS